MNLHLFRLAKSSCMTPGSRTTSFCSLFFSSLLYILTSITISQSHLVYNGVVMKHPIVLNNSCAALSPLCLVLELCG